MAKRGGISEETRERIKNVVIDDIKRANDYWMAFIEPKIIERQKRYKADKQYYEDKYRKLSKKSSFVSFDVYSYVEWAMPNIMQAFFGSEDIISIVGNEAEDVDRADKMNKLINYQLTQQNRGYLTFYDWFEEAIALGFGVIKCWWEREINHSEESAVLPIDRVNEMSMHPLIEIISTGEPDIWGDVPVKYRVGIVKKNQPVIESVSALDMRWSPEAKSLREANFVAQRKIINVDYLNRKAKQKIYDKEAVDEVIEKSGDIKFNYADKYNNQQLDNKNDETEVARRLVELYECYVKVDIDDDGILDDCIVTVANDVVIRIVKNPFGRIPFFDLSPNRDKYKVYSDFGVSEVLGEIQDLKVAIVRQLSVNLSLANNPRRFIKDSSINIDDLIEDKENIRITDGSDPRAVVFNEPPHSIAPWTMTFMEYLNTLGEEWTGKSRYNQGLDASSLNKTATGISMIMKAANQRIGQIIRGFAETGVGDVNKFLIELNQKYIDQSQVIRLMNEPMEISPDDLKGSLDIVVNVDVGVSEKHQVVQMLYMYLKEIYPYASNLGIATPDQFAAAAIRALKESGLTNASEYIKDPEIIRELMQQAEMMQQGAVQTGQMPGAAPFDNAPGMMQDFVSHGIGEMMQQNDELRGVY